MNTIFLNPAYVKMEIKIANLDVNKVCCYINIALLYYSVLIETRSLYYIIIRIINRHDLRPADVPEVFR